MMMMMIIMGRKKRKRKRWVGESVETSGKTKAMDRTKLVNNETSSGRDHLVIVCKCRSGKIDSERERRERKNGRRGNRLMCFESEINREFRCRATQSTSL